MADWSNFTLPQIRPGDGGGFGGKKKPADDDKKKPAGDRFGDLKEPGVSGPLSPVAPMNQGPRTLSEAMGKAGVGPPQQLESGSLQYPSGMRTWNTSGGNFTGGTGVSYPNAQGQHNASSYHFFNNQGNRINPNRE